LELIATKRTSQCTTKNVIRHDVDVDDVNAFVVGRAIDRRPASLSSSSSNIVGSASDIER